ncbi:flavo protein WrbA [Basidiobolus meristosporus CBS 931.73]|uniref:Flavo protein WrbA n=1 Tax=Basidiobolus meristosporus CBS 931.73 TaxID=1314790 RepID=A0A1Y1Y4E7_9FUNG|nr:flavo protein WrbA [Basidiobolus meristosporus CBS 931.73]|eukprot:ORX92454.1 flavo protein WrbA [Basidiobolus meristosporus CBS 931.73]
MSTPKPKVFIILYSLYGHVYKMAEAVKEGLESAGGVEVSIYQVAETLSAEVLEKMHAPPKPDIPVITPDKLPEADAFFFGIPTRYGSMPGQVQAFWDATGSLWMSGALRNKFASVFFSTAGQHGGQETTALTFMTTLVHHGMIFVPNGFASPHLSDNSEIVGGSAWGAGTLAGPDGSRQPTAKELEVARSQGQNFAQIVAKFHETAQSQPASTNPQPTAAPPPTSTSTQPPAPQPAAQPAPSTPTASPSAPVSEAPSSVADSSTSQPNKRKSFLKKLFS